MYRSRKLVREILKGLEGFARGWMGTTADAESDCLKVKLAAEIVPATCRDHGKRELFPMVVKRFASQTATRLPRPASRASFRTSNLSEGCS